MSSDQQGAVKQIEPPEARWATALFCEMIRFEQDGKFTLVGVHPGAKVRIERQASPEEATTILNFAIAVKLRFPRGDLVKPIKLLLTTPGGVTVNVDLQAGSAPTPDESRPEHLIVLATHLLRIQKSGFVEARVELEDGSLLHAGALHVELSGSDVDNSGKLPAVTPRPKRGKAKAPCP
jgi:hypothetical protein